MPDGIMLRVIMDMGARWAHATCYNGHGYQMGSCDVL